MDKSPCVYMLASSRNGTFYIGFTSNLLQRIAQHRAGQVEGFSKRHGVTRLVKLAARLKWFPAKAGMTVGCGNDGGEGGGHDGGGGI